MMAGGDIVITRRGYEKEVAWVTIGVERILEAKSMGLEEAEEKISSTGSYVNNLVL